MKAATRKALAADLRDEHEGVETYGRQATAFRRDNPKAARTVAAIRKDEKTHVTKIRSLMRRRSR